MNAESTDARAEALYRRHLLWGWCALLVFLTLGIVLEAFHGFKLRWYLDVENDTRRLLWRLAHTHGTLLGLVHLGFAATLRGTKLGTAGGVRLASAALLGATLLLPGGFLLGGISISAGDPGRAIVLVPVGAALLLGAVAWSAWRVWRSADA
ncbi:MAG: hypothetical protein EXS08_09140 [Planctomycetes bacterium]|nr:hypothetical protein [Planctomycetota bacterium]